MFYEPTYCNHCGEKIDRVKRGINTSRRFCESCASEFFFKEWIPRVIVCLGAIGVLYGVGAVLWKPQKTLNVTTSPAVVAANASPGQKGQQLLSSGSVQNTVLPTANASNALTPSAQQKQNSLDPKSTENLRLQTGAKSTNKQNAAQEPVYFCGAQTKKGTPCSRRVKGGGRCWQHAGQPAMLPPEKLLISQ